jgi:hypothetical protein
MTVPESETMPGAEIAGEGLEGQLVDATDAYAHDDADGGRRLDLARGKEWALSPVQP